MDENDADYETRRQQAFARLGSDDPRCVVCGEDDWRCLELHHLAGQAYDDQLVILCRNCHRKQSAPWTNEKSPAKPPMMEVIGHWLAGLVALLRQLAMKGQAFADTLFEGAKVCPWPYGWVGAPGVVQ